MVLELGHEHLVARAEPRARPRLCDKIDPLGRPAHEDDLARRRGADEVAHLRARALVGGGRFLREHVHAAVYVRVRPLVVVDDRLDHARGLLAGRGAVEVDQRLAVDATREDRELLAQRFDVERDHVEDSSGSQPSSACSSEARSGSDGRRWSTSLANA